MRFLHPRQRAALTARAGFTSCLRVLVQNASNAWVDLSDLLGNDWTTSAEWSASADDAVGGSATVVLLKGNESATLAPLDEDSVLNNLPGSYAPLLATGRLFRMEVASVPLGSEPESGGIVLEVANPTGVIPRTVTLGDPYDVGGSGTSAPPAVYLTGEYVPDGMEGTVTLTVATGSPDYLFNWAVGTLGGTDLAMYPGGIGERAPLINDADGLSKGIEVEWVSGEPYAALDAWEFDVTITPASTATSSQPTITQTGVLRFSGTLEIEVEVGEPDYIFSYTINGGTKRTIPMVRGTLVPMVLEDSTFSGLSITWPTTTTHYQGANWTWRVEYNDWAEVWRGRIDAVRTDGDDAVTISGRDLSGMLLDSFIETEREYGSTEGTALQTVMQSILTDNGYSTVSLYTPVDPLFDLGPFVQRKASVLGALQERAGQIGWDCRYKWRDDESTWRLTLYSPDRLSTTADWVVPDYAVGEGNLTIGEDSTQIRNSVQVVYSDPTLPEDQRRKTVTSTNPTSIALYGRRWMEIAEAAASNIDTAVEAQRLADAAVADLSMPLSTADLQTDLYWHLQPGDMVEVPPLRGLTSSSITGAVYAIRHRIAGDRASSQITLQGQPRLSMRAWGERDARPGIAASAPFTGPSKPTTVLAKPLVGGVAVDVTPAATGPQWDTFELHVSETADFTPSSDTLKGRSKSTTVQASDLTAGGTYYAKVVPFDAKANAGTPSDEVTVGARYVEPRTLQPAITYAALPLNSDFEAHNDTSAPPDAWSLVGGAWGVQADAITTGAFSGTRAVKLMTDTLAYMQSQRFVVASGDTLVLTVKFKLPSVSPAVNGAKFSAVFYNALLGTETVQTIFECPGSFGGINYTSAIGRISVPENTAYASIRFEKIISGAGEFIVDSTRVALVPETPSEQGWQAPTLLGAWVASGGGAPPPGYYKDSLGIVRLRGHVTGGAVGTTVFTLPAGYRPPYQHVAPVAATGAFGICTVETNGDVVAAVGTVTTFCMDGVSFRVS